MEWVLTEQYSDEAPREIGRFPTKRAAIAHLCLHRRPFSCESPGVWTNYYYSSAERADYEYRLVRKG